MLSGIDILSITNIPHRKYDNAKDRRVKTRRYS